jgi:hypothetical protein
VCSLLGWMNFKLERFKLGYCKDIFVSRQTMEDITLSMYMNFLFMFSYILKKGT